MDANQENSLKIVVDESLEDGTYANMAYTAHTSSEFILDFIQLIPNSPVAKVKSRVILAPEHVKRLMYILQQGVADYEKAFGTIRLEEEQQVPHISGVRGEA